MTMHKTMLIVAALGLAAPGVAAADDAPAPIELGAFLGWHQFSDHNELGAFDDDAQGTHLESAPGFGVRLAWTRCRLHVEGELFLLPTEAAAVEGSIEPAIEADDNLMVFAWRAHALFHFMDGRLRPFALAGVGALSTTSSDSGNILSDTDAMLHAGGGVKYGIKDAWGLRLDARAAFPPTTDGEFVTAEWEVLFGIYGTFTGPKPKPPEPPK